MTKAVPILILDCTKSPDTGFSTALIMIYPAKTTTCKVM